MLPRAWLDLAQLAATAKLMIDIIILDGYFLLQGRTYFVPPYSLILFVHPFFKRTDIKLITMSSFARSNEKISLAPGNK